MFTDCLQNVDNFVQIFSADSGIYMDTRRADSLPRESTIKDGIHMKRLITGLLAALMLLTLAACGAGNGDTSGNGDTPENSAEAGTTVSGVVNRLGDFLVLLTDDGEYRVFEFGEEVDTSSLEEGDSVTVTYTGELDSEDPAPVAVSIEKAES